MQLKGRSRYVLQGAVRRDTVSGLKGHRLILALQVRTVVSVIIFAGTNDCMTVR